jgi:hypothetical protein
VMAYAVAFFGVSWPDRVVKSRLFKWIMRGPVTASAALGLMTVVRRGGELFGTSYNAFVPLSVVVTVLLLEHLITLAAPLWERWLFFGHDRAELMLLQNIEERLLTRGDLQQFLESVLAAVRDHLQAPLAFVAALDNDALSLVVMAGNRNLLNPDNLSDALQVHRLRAANLPGATSGSCLSTSASAAIWTAMKSHPCWAFWVWRAVPISYWTATSAMRSGCWPSAPLWLWKTVSYNRASSVPLRICNPR